MNIYLEINSLNKSERLEKLMQTRRGWSAGHQLIVGNVLSIYSGEIAIHHLHGQSEEVAPLFTTIFGHRVIEGLQPSLFFLSLSVLCRVDAIVDALRCPSCIRKPWNCSSMLTEERRRGDVWKFEKQWKVNRRSSTRNTNLNSRRDKRAPEHRLQTWRENLEEEASSASVHPQPRGLRTRDVAGRRARPRSGVFFLQLLYSFTYTITVFINFNFISFTQ